MERSIEQSCFYRADVIASVPQHLFASVSQESNRTGIAAREDVRNDVTLCATSGIRDGGVSESQPIYRHVKNGPNYGNRRTAALVHHPRTFCSIPDGGRNCAEMN
jgi:hypothetical protein